MDSELAEALTDFCNGLEALCVNLRRQIQTDEKREWTWNPKAIKWSEAEGSKGKYERSEDVNNLEFKVLIKDLSDHKGSLAREGFFYWLFKNGYVVGRKRRVSSFG